ncbi:MAG: diguanylate cyclase [Actinomycetota bacterium]|nr:diguanylate cyclase [Actinomycetota bacterium]
MRDVAEAVLHGTGAVVLLLRPDGAVVHVNPAGLALLGRSLPELLGRDAIGLLAAPRDASGLRLVLRLVLRQVARSGVARTVETRLPTAEGVTGHCLVWAVSSVPAPGHGGEALRALVGVDVSSARSELEQLRSQALTDELTGLSNRAQVTRTLQQLAGTGATVLFCDLNGFKAVNDSYGHAAGDEVLVEVARRFVRAVRGEDLVARLGGDEFVIVAPAAVTSDPEGLRRRVLAAVRQPMLLSGGLVVLVGAAVGVARLEPGRDPLTVLQQADSAMYAGKPSRMSSAALVSSPG